MEMEGWIMGEKKYRKDGRGGGLFKQMGPGLLCVQQLLWDQTAEMPAAT